MLQVGTGEDWEKVILHFFENPSNCSNDATIQDIIDGTQSKCGMGLSIPFFTLFFITMKLLVLNSFLAIIIEGYSRSKIVNDLIVGKQEIDDFLQIWEEYDPDATGFISPENYLFLIKELEPPLGLKDEEINTQKAEVDYFKMIQKLMLISKNRKIVLLKPEIGSIAAEFDTTIINNEDGILIHITYVFAKLTKRAIENKYNIDNLDVSSERISKIIKTSIYDKFPSLKKIEKKEEKSGKRFITSSHKLHIPIQKTVSTYFAVRSCLEIYRRNRETKN